LIVVLEAADQLRGWALALMDGGREEDVERARRLKPH